MASARLSTGAHGTRWRSRAATAWLSRRPPFGGLVAWGRVRYRACWLSFGLEFTLNALRRLLPARANAFAKSIAPVRMGDPRSQQWHEDRQRCQHFRGIGSFILVASSRRGNLAVPGKSSQ
jgi:hypothetical protein